MNTYLDAYSQRTKLCMDFTRVPRFETENRKARFSTWGILQLGNWEAVFYGAGSGGRRNTIGPENYVCVSRSSELAQAGWGIAGLYVGKIERIPSLTFVSTPPHSLDKSLDTSTGCR
jgi:hypothetical protein